MNFYKKSLALFCAILCTFTLYSQKSNLSIEGLISDETNMSIPYAAITIKKINKGTSSTDEGTFYLSINSSNLQDTLTVSTIGFKTAKIKIQDFINLKNKVIILKENVTTLDDVVILKPTEYLKKALKNLKKTTVKTTHQLKILYRRASVEAKKSRFFIEQYIDVIDRGPSSYMSSINVVESRKSADYRFIKTKQYNHPVEYMAQQNPLRGGLRTKDYTWKKTGDTSYDNEDIVIIEGTFKKNPKKWLRLYVGLDNNGVYKIETSEKDAVYIYKKNSDGKLYLSYHNRTMIGWHKIDYKIQQRLRLKSDHVQVSYRHEIYVQRIETNRKKFKIKENFVLGTDMADMKIPYHPEFWKNVSLPPDTKFYKTIKSELKSHFGVPLETQFKLVNK
jgi:hypothetical protein